jgi:3-oxoacyl-[acyl-carrier protein] reductase
MKIALVSGASGGIGIETVKLLVQKGYVTFAQYNKDKKSLEQLNKDLVDMGYQGYLIPFKCDFSDKESVKKGLEFLSNNLKHIDVLVNNAGVDLYKLITETTEEEWDDIFAINVKSAFTLTKFALNSMISRKSGKIVNVSSIWGDKGGSMETAYSASKAALIGLTKALAKEVAPSGINVNCICPGVIDTKMNDCFSAEEKAENYSKNTIKSHRQPHRNCRAHMLFML